MEKIINWFKDLPYTAYVISSLIVSLGALLIYSKDTGKFRLEEYLLMAGIGWVLVFVLTVFFVLFMEGGGA